MGKYDEANEIEFTCVIKGGKCKFPIWSFKFHDNNNKDPTADSSDRDVKVKQEDDMTLRQLQAYIQTTQSLKGELTLYHNHKKLTNLYAPIGEVLKPGDTLVILNNTKAIVATGGFGMGGEAESNSSKQAVAHGGHATGGMFYPSGRSKGGSGTGGDAWGDYGAGGDGFGGGANNVHGKATAGLAVSGNFHKQEESRSMKERLFRR
ncbi:uncharacterized protein BO88DRAFT_469436 [Aspergillus vadensis CBS 113365]|uniref:Ubiquitin-like domain-containing protein n=1 Tax=Aspergillus vadensis (strain CBS 113365 / IMI 142717 / IBT 24658) TaxID=1448311 RepID=A0A319B7T0_ASPVC|nr:hypothetical protein BO88DRAFT_469436 [Aspergillus vadensis CBS 113365]PYH66430.1 hypothetical protein BO88DRAFT_469436 [Aspergillus vadensis CBS 113365]